MESVDVMDAVGSNIVLNTRAGDLMRIIPRNNDVSHTHSNRRCINRKLYFVTFFID